MKKAATARREDPPSPTWTFLTNHAHVLVCLSEDPTLRIRDLSARVGITERAVQRIIADLEEAGYLTHEREGRRNVYRVRSNRPLRHPLAAHQTLNALLGALRRAAR